MHSLDFTIYVLTQIRSAILNILALFLITMLLYRDCLKTISVIALRQFIAE